MFDTLFTARCCMTAFIKPHFDSGHDISIIRAAALIVHYSTPIFTPSQPTLTMINAHACFTFILRVADITLRAPFTRRQYLNYGPPRCFFELLHILMTYLLDVI